MQPMPQARDSSHRRQASPEPPTALPMIRSRDLLQGGNLILIEHAGDRYYLRMTRNNKLILTK